MFFKIIGGTSLFPGGVRLRCDHTLNTKGETPLHILDFSNCEKCETVKHKEEQNSTTNKIFFIYGSVY